MRAVQLDFADRAFPATLVDVPAPELPGPAWARVQVAAGGLCGSDLHLFKPTTGPTPVLVAWAAYPMVLGHELAGTVVEAGPGCPVPVGTRVAVDPVITCEARGVDPPCRYCAGGLPSACSSVTSGVGTPGMGLGFTTGLGGGWAEQAVAHASQLHPLPDAVPLEDACLHEPLSIAAHGLERLPPPLGAPVLVVGAGVIGLAAVAALRHRFPTSPITVVARHPHQARAAALLGATAVLHDADVEGLAEASGSRIVQTPAGPVPAEGFRLVVEAVGSPTSVTTALRWCAPRGGVLLLGAAGVGEVDLSTVWAKEQVLAGSFCHGPEGHDSPHSIDRALEILAAGGFPASVVVSHRFPLEEVHAAVATAVDRASGARKVLLVPGGTP